MSVRLSEATTEELNAAFDAVEDKIELLIANFVPSFFRRQAMEELHSPRGRALLLDAVDAAIDAVEEIRKRKARSAMGQFGKDIAQVTVQSDWWSEVNWTQVVGWVCSGAAIFTSNQFEVDPATQVKLVFTVQAVAGLLTIWFRRNSTTITPTAAAKLEKK